MAQPTATPNTIDALPLIREPINQEQASTEGINDIACGGCGRVLKVRVEPALPIPEPKGQSCDRCEPLAELVATLQRAEQTYKDLPEGCKGREKRSKKKYAAVDAIFKARAEYENFVLRLEDVEHDQLRQGLPEVLQGQKRKRVSSPSKVSLPLAKRLKGGNDASEMSKKAIMFDSSIVAPDESAYRPMDAFGRGNDIYVRGRNAPSEGVDFLDTSGYCQKDNDFYGQRYDFKLKTYVELSEQELEERAKAKEEAEKKAQEKKAIKEKATAEKKAKKEALSASKKSKGTKKTGLKEAVKGRKSKAATQSSVEKSSSSGPNDIGCMKTEKELDEESSLAKPDYIKQEGNAAIDLPDVQAPTVADAAAAPSDPARSDRVEAQNDAILPSPTTVSNDAVVKTSPRSEDELTRGSFVATSTESSQQARDKDTAEMPDIPHRAKPLEEDPEVQHETSHHERLKKDVQTANTQARDGDCAPGKKSVAERGSDEDNKKSTIVHVHVKLAGGAGDNGELAKTKLAESGEGMITEDCDSMKRVNVDNVAADINGAA